MSDRDEQEQIDRIEREPNEENRQDHAEEDGEQDGRLERNHEGGEDHKSKDDGPTTSLLVRNLSFHVRPEDIKKLFSEFGDIRDVYIPNDYYTKRPKGFAFVEFFHHDEAMRALDRLDKHEYDGRELSVEVAKDRRKTPDEMRPRGRPRDSGRGNGRDYGRGGGGAPYGRGGGGYGGDRNYPPREYGGRPYEYDRPPFRPEYAYGGRRSRSRSREYDRYDYRPRPDFRGRDDRFYVESARGPPEHHRSYSPPHRPIGRSRSGSRN